MGHSADSQYHRSFNATPTTCHCGPMGMAPLVWVKSINVETGISFVNLQPPIAHAIAMSQIIRQVLATLVRAGNLAMDYHLFPKLLLSTEGFCRHWTERQWRIVCTLGVQAPRKCFITELCLETISKNVSHAIHRRFRKH